MERRPDIIVIGAGIIGLLTARELAADGASVHIIDREPSARGASWAGGGILSPLMPWEAATAIATLADWSMARYPELCATLAAQGEADPGYRRCGVLALGEASRITEARAEDAAEALDAAALAARVPGLGPSWSDALLLPEVAQVRNPRLMKALIAEADVAPGVTLGFGLNASGLKVDDQGPYVVLADGNRLRAPRIVVAAGAWSARLLAAAGVEHPVRPVRGQMLRYFAPDLAQEHILMDGERYLIPREDGNLIIGSTIEDAGFEGRTTAAGLAELKAFAAEVLPALAERSPDQSWAGLRPWAPGGIPSIGAVPGLPGVWLNTGHFRLGLTLAPASARLLADLIGGSAPCVDPQPYTLA